MIFFVFLFLSIYLVKKIWLHFKYNFQDFLHYTRYVFPVLWVNLHIHYIWICTNKSGTNYHFCFMVFSTFICYIICLQVVVYLWPNWAQNYSHHLIGSSFMTFFVGVIKQRLWSLSKSILLNGFFPPEMKSKHHKWAKNIKTQGHMTVEHWKCL